MIDWNQKWKKKILLEDRSSILKESYRVQDKTIFRSLFFLDSSYILREIINATFNVSGKMTYIYINHNRVVSTPTWFFSIIIINDDISINKYLK